MKLVTLLFVSVLALSGCAMHLEPTENNQSTTTLVLDAPAETVYLNLVRNARARCVPLTIDAQFYPDKAEGDVAFTSTFDASMSVKWAEYFISQDGKKSIVLIKMLGKNKDFLEPSIKWMSGLEAKCPIDRR